MEIDFPVKKGLKPRTKKTPEQENDLESVWEPAEQAKSDEPSKWSCKTLLTKKKGAFIAVVTIQSAILALE